MSLELDPDKGAFIFVCGAKGRGKSELCKSYFRAYPYTRVLIDANSDVDPEDRFTQRWEPSVELVRPRGNGQPPLYKTRLPEPDGRWPSLRYEVDFTEPDAIHKVDAVLAAVYELGLPACVWIDEVGEFAPSGRTTGYMRQALHKGRHRRLTLIMAGPRPMGIDVLILAQADVVAMFDTPHELDRQRLAAELGIPIGELNDLLDNLERYGYLAFDSWERELLIMPPLELR